MYPNVVGSYAVGVVVFSACPSIPKLLPFIAVGLRRPIVI